MYNRESGKQSKFMTKILATETIPYPPPSKAKFTFIDLFAGIGGFRIAFQELGGRCIFSSEWDKYAQKTYFRNFGEAPCGDIKKFTSSEKISD